MGGIISGLFETAGDVADLIESVAERLGPFFEKVVSILENIKKIFGTEARVPVVIKEAVAISEAKIENMDDDELSDQLLVLGQKIIDHANEMKKKDPKNDNGRKSMDQL